MGIAIISFNTDIFVPTNISFIDETVLQIKVKPNKTSDPKKMGIASWSIISNIIFI